jgi:hypothetical protein
MKLVPDDVCEELLHDVNIWLRKCTLFRDATARSLIMEWEANKLGFTFLKGRVDEAT